MTNLTSLPHGILPEILGRLPEPDFLNLASTSRSIHAVTQDHWRNVLNSIYHLQVHGNPTEWGFRLTNCQDPLENLQQAIAQGEEGVTRHILQTLSLDFNSILQEVLSFLTSASKPHLRLLIERLASQDPPDETLLGLALEGAASLGDLTFIRGILSQLEPFLSKTHYTQVDLYRNRAIVSAARAGEEAIANLLIEDGERNSLSGPPDIQLAIFEATLQGHRELVKNWLERFPQHMDVTLIGTVHRDDLLFFLELMALHQLGQTPEKIYQGRLTLLFEESVSRGAGLILRELLPLGQFDLNEALRGAARAGDLDLLQELYHQIDGPVEFPLLEAVESGGSGDETAGLFISSTEESLEESLKIIRWLFDLVLKLDLNPNSNRTFITDPWAKLPRAILLALKRNKPLIVEYLISILGRRPLWVIPPQEVISCLPRQKQRRAAEKQIELVEILRRKLSLNQLEVVKIFLQGLGIKGLAGDFLGKLILRLSLETNQSQMIDWLLRQGVVPSPSILQGLESRESTLEDFLTKIQVLPSYPEIHRVSTQQAQVRGDEVLLKLLRKFPPGI